MKILHTADWHLGDRLGRIDRTDDLRRAVERVADYCAAAQVDVLLVAGDLFSELARPDGLREAIRHVQETFRRLPARRRHHPHADRQPRQRELLPDPVPRHEPGRPRRRRARRPWPRPAGSTWPPQPTFLRLRRPARRPRRCSSSSCPTRRRRATSTGRRRSATRASKRRTGTCSRPAPPPWRGIRAPPALRPEIAGRAVGPRPRPRRRGVHAVPHLGAGGRRLRERGPAGRLRLRRPGAHPQAAVHRRPRPRPLLRQHRAAWTSARRATTRAWSCSRSGRRACAAAGGAAARIDAGLRRGRAEPARRAAAAVVVVPRRRAALVHVKLQVHGRRGQPRRERCASWRRSSRAGTPVTGRSRARWTAR